MEMLELNLRKKPIVAWNLVAQLDFAQLKSQDHFYLLPPSFQSHLVRLATFHEYFWTFIMELKKYFHPLVYKFFVWISSNGGSGKSVAGYKRFRKLFGIIKS